jgi:hypothetical protein
MICNLAAVVMAGPYIGTDIKARDGVRPRALTPISHYTS